MLNSPFPGDCREAAAFAAAAAALATTAGSMPLPSDQLGLAR